MTTSGAHTASAPVADMSLDDRGTSLPILEKFRFPPPQLPTTAPQPRFSEAISPRQLPQTVSPAMLQVGGQSQFGTTSDSPPTVRLDQISCLDFNGCPAGTLGQGLNHPSIDAITASRNGNITFNRTAGGTDGRATGAPTLPSLPTPQTSIPFTMYSMGNLVTVPFLPQTSTPPLSYSPPSAPLRLQGSGMPVAASNAGKGLTGASGSEHHHRRHHHLQGPLAQRSLGGLPALQSATDPGASAAIHLSQPNTANCLCSRGVAGGPHRPQSSVPLPGCLGHQNTRNRPHQGVFQTSNTAVPSIDRPNASTNPIMPPPPPPSPTRPIAAHVGTPTLPSRSTPPHDLQRMNSQARKLFLDVAETVEAVFPYDVVAARHGVPPSRVSEALAGIVLLPLLHAVNKPHADTLATDRMREYNEVARRTWQGGAATGRRDMAPRVDELLRSMSSAGMKRSQP